LALLPLMAAAALVDGPNATVYAIARGADGTTYLGGDFTLWGPRTGGFGALATTDGAVDHNFPRVAGTVYAIQSDGAGGWFIGGVFTAVGGLARTNLARIDSSGAVTAWAPAADNYVRALALSGTTLYAGGDFTAITPPGGSATTRNRLAAISTADTGSLTAWAPAASSTVHALALSGTTLYAGGDFTTITPPGGSATSRNRLAAINTTDTGSLTTWAPAADSTVYALALSGTTLYAGGAFATITPSGSTQTTRNRLAAISTADTGSLTAWAPAALGTVRALALSGTTLYAGGQFTAITRPAAARPPAPGWRRSAPPTPAASPTGRRPPTAPSMPWP
jgi:hypothetical protein